MADPIQTAPPIVPPGVGTPPPVQAAPNMDQASQAATQMDQMQSPAAAVASTVPAAQPAQISPDDAHSMFFGKAAKMLMGNNTTYSVGPDGKTVATQTPNTPGSFFRNILSAAVLGGAAGANSNGSFAQGAAQGGAAVIGHQQQQDQLKRQQAQEDFKNSQEADKANQQKTLTAATVANMHAETAARQQTTDLLSKEDHDKHNAATAALETGLRTAGGVDAQIPVNGVPKSDMTAPELGVAYAQDPSIRNGPDGFTRHFIDTTDSSDVTFNGVHWVTADGDPVNMTDKTTIKAIDVPDNAMNKKQMLQGDQLNKIGGNNIFDPKKSYPVSPQEADDMNAKRIVNEQKMALTNLEERKANIEAARVHVEASRLNHEFDMEKKNEFGAAAKMVSENIKSLQAQTKDPLLDPKLKAHLNDQITQANSQLAKYFQKAYPGMKLEDAESAVTNGAAGGGSSSVAHPQVVDILSAIPGFSPDIAAKIGNMSPEAIHDQLAQSSLPLETKNKIMAAIGQQSISDPNKLTWKPSVTKAASAVGNVLNNLKNIPSPL